ncbi:High affinity cAMP-specific 3',5'-cyclic phosphodiesterase 7A [Eumeta japonica]|uniref:High affinity cAMP-specific 3',5'-cyclic phosphodiesterase 7A n=1 Tax=Eumeta variegata TaxID=151549 RepID=A0A4C1SFW0_EUMVA|nr:High affinity cAMP-specific 3',5'-cyclic phosphodiesterase 7A [Eumeta japonica]
MRIVSPEMSRWAENKPLLEKKNGLLAYLDTNTLDLTKGEHRLLVLQIALKCADISNPCRPWEISRKWSFKVCDEFFRQGDYERKLNLPVTALCDRHTISIPKIQTGFFKFVVAPLIAEWHRFLHNDLSSQMSQNLLYNQCKWEMLLAQEIAEETRTEISDAELVEDELDTSPGIDISESAEQLLPLRRGSLNPAQVPSDKYKDHLSLGEQCDHHAAADPVHLSTECLRPDSSIASITTPRQATRLSCVLKDGPGWKLIRQQTFPPLEATPRPRPAARHVSDEDAIYPSQHTKTEYGQNYTDAASSGLSSIYKKNDSDKTDNENASEDKVDIGECSSNLEKENLDSTTASGRRGSAPEASALLRHNLSATELHCAGTVEDPAPAPQPHHLRRRKSMPTEMLSTGKECWSQRRGSAPAPVEISQLRGLASLAAMRLSVPGGRRKPNPITSCQQWLAKTTYTVQERTTHLPRRSSLPVEVYPALSLHAEISAPAFCFRGY